MPSWNSFPASGSRWVPYHGFHTGYKQMIIRPDELLARIRLPRTTKGLRQYYRKVGTRKAQAISKICFAAVARMNGDEIADVRIALGSVAPIPIRCVATEAALRNQRLDRTLIEKGKQRISERDCADRRHSLDARLSTAGFVEPPGRFFASSGTPGRVICAEVPLTKLKQYQPIWFPRRTLSTDKYDSQTKPFLNSNAMRSNQWSV